jgi:cellulose synthase/poly-beta-1,6-N-acetylglucosamine synthase-like glycosyltransferase
LIPGWLAPAMRLLDARPEIAGVTGIFIDIPRDTAVGTVPNTSEEAVCEVRFLCGRVCLYRREVLDQVGNFNPYLLAEEEAELALRIRRAGYRLAEIRRPAGFHRSDEPILSFYYVLSRWRRGFYFAEGQILRHLLGTRQFWTFARERGNVFAPALALLLVSTSFATSAATHDWRWFEFVLIVGTMVFAAQVLRKRSLYVAARSLFVHLLLVAGTIRGALRRTPDARTYRLDICEPGQEN